MSVHQDFLNLKLNINGDNSRAQLVDLKKKVSDLSAEMKGLTRGTDEYKSKAAELKEATNDMEALKSKIGLAGLSMKELRQEMVKLTAMRDSAVPFSKEYNEFQNQLEKVKDRMFEVRNGVEGFSATVLKAIPNIKALSIVSAAAFGAKVGFDWVKDGLASLPKLSDQLADVQRVAGMTDQEVDDLNNTLKGLNTRTSYEGLRNIAEIAGKLGIAKDDIADFTAAVDKLQVSLGSEMGDADQITETLGKILNVYDGKITAENITTLGNALVHMANAGVASAGFVSDFTQRLSGMAEAAHLSLSDVIGLGAGMEESGQRVESSSTAIINLLGTMTKNTAKFAQAAGISYKDFAEQVRSNPLQALLDFSKAVTANNNDLSSLIPIFKDLNINGSRVTTTIALLGSKSDFFRQKMTEAGQAIQGTGEIQDAFSLKNNTLAAQLEKVGKNLTSVWNNSGLARRLGEAAGALADMLAPAKSATDQFHDMKKEVDNLTQTINPLLTRYDQLKTKTKLSHDEQVELNKIINTLSNTVPGVVTQFDQYGNALGINTKKVRDYIEAQQALLAQLNQGAIKDWRKRKAQAEAENQFYQKQKQEILKSGTLTQTYVGGSGTGGAAATTSTRQATKKDLDDINKKLHETYVSANAATQQLRELHGWDNGLPKANNNATTTGGNTGNTSSLPPDEDAKKAAEKAAKAAARAAANEKSEYQKLMEDIAKMRTELDNKEENADDAEVARIQTKYDELLKRARKYSDAVFQIEGMREKELEMLQNKRWAESDKKYQENYNKKIEKDNEDLYGNIQKQTELHSEKQKVKAAEDYAAGKLTYKQYNQELSKIDEQTAQQKIDNANMASGISKQAEKDLVTLTDQAEEKKRQAIIKTAESRKEQAQRNVDLLGMKSDTTGMTNPQWSSKTLDAQKKYLEAQKAYELEYVAQTEEEKAALKDHYNALIQEAEKQHWLAMLDYATQYVDSFSSALSSLSTFLSNRDTAELNKQKKLDDQKKASYQKQLNSKLISQKQYDAKIEAIDDAADKREKIAARKQAEREKAINLFNAITSNAAAILKTMASVPFPANIPLAIAQGIAGGIQVAAIANTPLPELGTGGLLENGPKHADQDKGLVVMNPRTGKPEMLLERNEAVLSSKTMDDQNNYTVSGTPSQIASALNALNGGKSWDSGAVVKQMTWANSPAPAINDNAIRVMAMGGSINAGNISTATSISNSDALLQQVVAELQQNREEMKLWKDRLQAVVSIKQLDDTRALYDTAKKASGF